MPSPSRSFFNVELSVHGTLLLLGNLLTSTSTATKLFNWGAIDFSALVCSRKPKCNKCPLKEKCSYYLYTSTG